MSLFALLARPSEVWQSWRNGKNQMASPLLGRLLAYNTQLSHTDVTQWYKIVNMIKRAYDENSPSTIMQTQLPVKCLLKTFVLCLVDAAGRGTT